MPQVNSNFVSFLEVVDMEVDVWLRARRKTEKVEITTSNCTDITRRKRQDSESYVALEVVVAGLYSTSP